MGECTIYKLIMNIPCARNSGPPTAIKLIESEVSSSCLISCKNGRNWRLYLEWHYCQFQPATLTQHSVDPNRLDENMKDGFFYRANLLLNYRLGEFWKLNGLYEYSRQRTSAGGYNKAFIQQTWGGGLVMYF